MPDVVSLRMIVDELDTLSDDYTVYLDNRTNETVGLAYDDLRAGNRTQIWAIILSGSRR